MNQKLLQDLGLNDKEIRVFKALLNENSLTPDVLAKKAGIKRTTAYSVARSLSEKGFLAEDSTKRPRTFSVASSKDILVHLEEEKKTFLEKEKISREFAEKLTQRVAEKSYPVPKIRFVEENKIEKFLKSETQKWHWALENLEEPIWWGFQDDTFVKEFSKWIDWQWGHAPESVSLKMLTNKSDIEKKIALKHSNREVRFLEKGGNFISSTWVIEEYVVIVNTQRHPFYLYEIHDPLLSNDLREIFRSLWNK